MHTRILSAIRAARPRSQSLGAGQVVVDWLHNEIQHQDGRRCELSAREAALLACLAGQMGKPVSRAEILMTVWHLNPRSTLTRTIDMHISFLRKKLGDTGKRPALLVTIRDVGYMLCGDGPELAGD